MAQIFKEIKKDIVIHSILTILLSVAMVSEAYLMQLIIDSIKVSIDNYVRVAIFILIFLIFQTVLYYFQQSLTSIICKKSVYIYRKKIFHNIQNTSLESVTGNKNAKLLASLTTQIEQIERDYFYSIYWGGYLLCQLIVAVVISIYINPIMALLTIILSLPNLIVTISFKSSLEKKQDNIISENNSVVSSFQDIVDGISDWKTSSADVNIFKLFKKVSLKYFEVQKQFEKFQYLVISLNQLFSNTLYFGSWLIGGFFILKGQLSLGSLIAFSQLLVRISYPVYTSSDLLSRYISGKKTLKYLNEEFLYKAEGEKLMSVNSIALCDFVAFNANRDPLFKLNINFLYGEKYLLIGKSGSGKSTILKSILRENVDYQGVITINGEDISNFEENSIYKKISYVPQQPHIFKATLKDNLTLFDNHYTNEQIYVALRFVELSKWANPESLARKISSESGKLSGGEAKRVALARALLINRDILLIDEFSSGIDLETLERIEERITALNKMVIYVTHSNIDNLSSGFSKVINLDKY